MIPVPFDPELAPVLEALAADPQPALSREALPAMRDGAATAFPSAEAVIGDRPIDAVDRVIPGPPGAPDLEVARARIEQSRATLRNARAQRLPSISASTAALRTKGANSFLTGGASQATGANGSGRSPSRRSWPAGAR